MIREKKSPNVGPASRSMPPGMVPYQMWSSKQQMKFDKEFHMGKQKKKPTTGG